MASNFTAVNPKRVGNEDGSPIQTTNAARDAVDSKTWKRGEFGHLASGKVQPNTTTTGQNITCVQFAEDQDTATSSSTVKVHELRRGDRFELYVTNNGTDAAVGVANVGSRYGIYTASNVAYLDLNATSGDFLVIEVASVYEPERNAAADTPGKCIVAYDPIA